MFIPQEKHEIVSDFLSCLSLVFISATLFFIMLPPAPHVLGLSASSKIFIEYSVLSESTPEESEVLPYEEISEAPAPIKRKEVKKEKKETQARQMQKSVAGDSQSEGVFNSQSEIDEFINSFLLLVQKHLYYPKNARRAGISGIVEIKISFDDSGQIENFTISKNNNRKILSDAALKTLERVKENWPPRELPISALVRKQTLIIPIHFELR